MKIGILIKDFTQLGNWELRIINQIINDETLELALLIKDGRVGKENVKSKPKRIKSLISSGNFFGKTLFKVQQLLEKRMFKPLSTVNQHAVIEYLNTVKTISLKPKRKGFLDIFSKKDADLIKQVNLDIILRHEFNIIRGPILEASKHGIWSFHHADNAINRGGPAGFWEIVFKQVSVGVTLQRLTPELDGGYIIDKAFFNYHWSFVKTNNMILEASVSLLFKNIRQLQKDKLRLQKSPVYFNPLYKTPNLRFTIKYMFNFYRKLASKTYDRILYKLFGIRFHCWSLYLGKGDFMEATLFRLKAASLPKDEFWADPFLFRYQEETYVFFENYSYTSKLGKISCGRVEGHNLVEVVDVLDLDYHLSFPNVFEENGDIFLMPESNENKRLEIYKCIEFPHLWELYTTAFEGEQVADASFYTDSSDQKWLFVNKKVAPTTPFDSELFIYKIDSYKLQHLQPHQQNPVLINAKTARNAGAIFEYANDFYRPSQANIEGVYGRGLNLNKINTLTLEEYSEETIVTVMPNFKKGLKSIHHLHQIDGLFVIDAAYKRH